MYHHSLLADGLPPYEFAKNFPDLEEPLKKPTVIFKEASFPVNKNIEQDDSQIRELPEQTDGYLMV